MASSKSKGRTAMAHARALCAIRWPGAPVLEAQPRIVWRLDRNTGKRIPMNVDEDFFGAFDLIVMPMQTIDDIAGWLPIYLQVTTYGAKSGKTDTSSARRRKVRDNFLDRFPGARMHPNVYVIAWETRKHFHVWHWSPSRQEWLGASHWEAPLPKKKAPDVEDAEGQSASQVDCPF